MAFERSIIQKQGSILQSTRIDPWVQNDKNFKLKLQEESRGNIPSKSDPCLFVMASQIFLGYRHLGFRAKDRSLRYRFHYKWKVAIFLDIFKRAKMHFPLDFSSEDRPLDMINLNH